MSAHTPGPWKLELESRTHAVGSELMGFVISAPHAPHHPVICEVFPRPYPVAVSEANARLIAAAPDLLARLTDLCVSLRIPVYGQDDFECYSKEHEAAEVLLCQFAKAGK